jgi:hypothetical protein
MRITDTMSLQALNFVWQLISKMALKLTALAFYFIRFMMGTLIPRKIPLYLYPLKSPTFFSG